MDNLEQKADSLETVSKGNLLRELARIQDVMERWAEGDEKQKEDEGYITNFNAFAKQRVAIIRKLKLIGFNFDEDKLALMVAVSTPVKNKNGKPFRPYRLAESIDRKLSNALLKFPIGEETARHWLLFVRTVKSSLDIVEKAANFFMPKREKDELKQDS